MKRFDLIASVKGLIKDKAYEAGNGITMVTSNRAGIALTFADSDLGMYGDIGIGGGWLTYLLSFLFSVRPANPGLFHL